MPGFNVQDYETVDSRLHRFWDDITAAKLTAAIETELVEVARDGDGRPLQYVVRTTITISDGRKATGLAEEQVGTSPVNKTSALENAETSSTGRALAQLGYSPKGARPSAEEMGKAERIEKAAPKPKPAAKPADKPGESATPEQWGSLLQRFGSKNAVVIAARAKYGEDVTDALHLTRDQAAGLLAA